MAKNLFFWGHFYRHPVALLVFVAFPVIVALPLMYGMVSYDILWLHCMVLHAFTMLASARGLCLARRLYTSSSIYIAIYCNIAIYCKYIYIARSSWSGWKVELSPRQTAHHATPPPTANVTCKIYCNSSCDCDLCKLTANVICKIY